MTSLCPQAWQLARKLRGFPRPDPARRAVRAATTASSQGRFSYAIPRCPRQHLFFRRRSSPESPDRCVPALSHWRVVRTFDKTGLPPEFGSNPSGPGAPHDVRRPRAPQTRRVQLESEKWRSVCGARVEDDLVVLPELLEKPTGVLGTTCSRSFPHDFLNGVRAVDCGEDPLQCRINRKGEIGVGVGPIDQHGRKAGWYPLADAEGPR